MDILSGKTVERHFDLNKALIDFHDLFNIKNGDDRTIAIIGATFLEMTLEHILFSFFPDNNKDVEKMMDFNQPMGNFSNKITPIKIFWFLNLIKIFFIRAQRI